MIVEKLPSGPFATNAYILACPITLKAAIIDPGVDSAGAILATVQKEQLVPVVIVLTHSHWDHIADVKKLSHTLHIPVCIHRADSGNLESPGSDGLPLFFPITPATVDRYLEEGDRVKIGKTDWEVIHTPGHTPGGICLYNRDDAILISGDTLFKGSIGNLSFPTAEPEKMWDSLAKLSHLPKETRVLPGHGDETTIGNERWLPSAKNYFS